MINHQYKGRHLKILLIIYWLTFNSCSETKEHVHFRFARKPFMLSRPTLLRTDGVYLRTTSGMNYQGKTFVGYSFYRFYENGRCYDYTWREGVPNEDSLRVTSKSSGQRTFYRVKENNLICETWGGYYTRYCFDYGIVDTGKFTVTSYKPRGFYSATMKLPEPEIYYFKPLVFKDSADW